MPDLPKAKRVRPGQTQQQADRERWGHAIESSRERLRLIRLCKAIPEPKRREKAGLLAANLEHVYLKTNQRKRSYKIGFSRRHLKKRSSELKGLYTVAYYRTVVYKALEKAAHAHFSHIRWLRKDRKPGQPRHASGERFWLSEEDAAGFHATMAMLEQWVLPAEEARLELWIAKLEAACKWYDEMHRPPGPALFDD